LSWFKPLAKMYRIYAPDTIGHPGFSEQNRISAKDNSFALWLEELMNYLNIESCAFIGPSYGAGIILRLAVFLPQKIDCSILVAPAGIQLGSKLEMIKQILLPLILFKITSSRKHLDKIANIMSDNCMKVFDKQIIGDIFKYVKLEQDMPKLTTKEELINYIAPTLLITGQKDIFFPAENVSRVAEDIINNLISITTYDMGHIPSEEHLRQMNERIIEFLYDNY
ncbi:MAG TPA: alpha/beta hydrolase, partial [Rummeliibacillus sp.]|nr:alpha/beta hydrolase [Rummeliibacillus sp.]